MTRKLFTVVSILAFLSCSPSAFAGEMERFRVISNQDLFRPITQSWGHRMEYRKFENPLRETALHSPRINHISNHKMFVPVSKSHLNNPISKPYMEPVSPMMTRWDGGIHDHMQKQFERSFVNSVPDPSALYVGEKLKNDLYKTANTMISVGTAAIGGPLSKIGAVANVIHNFGPQTGRVQDVSRNVGDVVSGVGALKTASQAVRSNFSNLGTGAVGLANAVFGKVTDAHKMTLRQPVTTSATKHYRFGFNDGFTGTQRVGTITVTKTYTPPKTIKAFGPPDIFEGTTTTAIHKREVVRTNTGNFNHAFSGNYSRPSNFSNYQRPRFTGYQTFKSGQSFTPSFRSTTFSNTTFRPGSFSNTSFRMPTYRAPSFGSIR